MRMMKVKMSSDFMKLLEFDAILPVIKYFEITQIYQYDLHTFFSMQKITCQPKTLPVFKEIIKKISNVEIFHIIEEKKDEIICVLKQRVTQGFWPEILRQENFAIIPPIQVDQQYIKSTVIINEAIEDQLETLSKLVKSFEILTNTSVQNPNDTTVHPLPHYTERQREIATYAMRNGFYDSPKKITADAIAAHFQISVSAMNEHLRKSERIAMQYFFA